MAAFKPVVFTCIPNLGKSGGGVVWDPDAGPEVERVNKNGVTSKVKTGAALATFDSNGECIVDNKKQADALKKLGFKVLRDADANDPDTDQDDEDTGGAPE